MCLLILERKEGTEGARKRGTSMVAFCMCPDSGSNPQPRNVPQLGIEPETFLVHRTMFQPTEPPGQGSSIFSKIWIQF